ncbi:uroporphyrinogen-III synthase [Salinisphaera sp. USBA-960]|nr:uroporphyrinogen-III synthase [Salifodinibacter halophilus]NNC26650.1 uroporphyrinogen-III synthase [Salifodinibacter halophilus]
MIETRGGQVARCPLIAIRDTPDIASVENWLSDVCAQGLDTMIWMTGEGVTRLNGLAERLAVRQHLHEVLADTRAITRGPKPVRALRAIGLGSDFAAPTPTTDGMIEALGNLNLAGARVGLQLYGAEPNHKLQDAVRGHDAEVLPVAPYVYADQVDDDTVDAFIHRIIAGELDAVALTSTAQVKRLFTVADRHNRRATLTSALQATCVAAVGPLVADALATNEVDADLMPEGTYFLKPLVRALVNHFTAVPFASDAPGG